MAYERIEQMGTCRKRFIKSLKLLPEATLCYELSCLFVD